MYCNDSELEKINLHVTHDTTLEVGLNNLKAHTVNEHTGPLFVPGTICMKPGSEYSILQGVYQFEAGKGNILILNMSNECISFKDNKLISRVVRLPEKNAFLPNSDLLKVNNVSVSETIKSPAFTEPKPPITMEMLNLGPAITEKDKTRLLQLVNDFRDCFALDSSELGVTHVTEMSIRLNDATPVCYKPYRLPFSERAKVREMIGDLLANGIIQESESPYASPIVLVRKKNNDYRLCVVDYRALNKNTLKDPMPVIDDQLDRLSGKLFFTSLDLASGYHQIPVAENSRHITGFVTPDGHYEYTRMPLASLMLPQSSKV